jgi:hypothetical protein
MQLGENKRGFRGESMDSKTKAAIRLIALITAGFLMITGCTGPRWTGLSNIKKKELAPEYDIVRITSTPSGGKVFVDERLVGLTPLSFQLSFRRVKRYQEDLFMDGNKILERRRLNCGMEYIPASYDIKIVKRGYKVCSLTHTGDNQDGRYHANIVLQEE